jgi:hypothetical protein
VKGIDRAGGVHSIYLEAWDLELAPGSPHLATTLSLGDDQPSCTRSARCIAFTASKSGNPGVMARIS